MKKWIAIALSMLLVLTCLTGCSKDAPETEEEQTAAEETAQQTEEASTEETFEGKTLSVYTDLTEGSAAHTAYMEQVGKFEEKTGCTVTVGHYGEDLAVVLDNALRNVGGVDVFPVTSLSDLAAKTSYALDLTAYADGVEETSYAVCLEQIKGLSAGTALYAVPSAPSAAAVWYNRAAFEAAGIEAAPATVEEFEALCEKLVAAGYQPMALDGAYVLQNFAVHMERAVGAETAAQLAANGGWADNADAVAACQQLIDWIGKGYFDENAPAPWPFSQLGLADKTAMIFADLATVEMAEEMIGEDIAWGCFPYPGESKTVQADFAALCVNADTAEPELAWEFIRFMTTGEADQAISAAADTVPADRGNTSENYAQLMQLLTEAESSCDYSRLLKGNVDLTEAVSAIYAGTYADGTAAATALDALYQ